MTSASEDARVLAALARSGVMGERRLAREAGLPPAALACATERLRADGLVAIGSGDQVRQFQLTARGEREANDGLPERRILDRLVACGPSSVAADGDERTAAAIGWLRRSQLVGSLGRELVALSPARPDPLAVLESGLRRLRDAGPVDEDELPADEARVLAGRSRSRQPERDLVRITNRQARTVALTALGAAAAGRSHAPPPRPRSRPAAGSRRHPYRQVLDWGRRVLVGLGFEEVDGPPVMSEFWSMDALFMPRLHPAREASFHVLDPAGASAATTDEDVADLLPGVAAAHAGGRGEEVDVERARRLVLRSHATALTVQLLAARRPREGRYFTIVRCFRRPRQIDASHTADFYMIDCIAAGAGLHFGHLLGLMRACERELTGSADARFVPGYEPFVEPSVYMVKDGVDSRDFAGGGLLRPEVTRPLGVDVPVLAFWLGLNQIAMDLLGLTDVRHLYPAHLGALRSMPAPLPRPGGR